MTQVLIRRTIANKTEKELVRANVIAQTGDMLRVLPEGQTKSIEVLASETIPANTYGTMQRSGIVVKQYPTSPNALMHRLR